MSHTQKSLANLELDVRDLRKSMDLRFDRVEEKLEKLDQKFDARIDRLDGKYESKLDTLSTRGFTLMIAIISAAATLAGTVLTIIFAVPHGH